MGLGPRPVRMVALVFGEIGNVDPLGSSAAPVSGSGAVAGGDSGGIDAFVSGSKVMSPAALSCVCVTHRGPNTHTAPRPFASGLIGDLFFNLGLFYVVLM